MKALISLFFLMISLNVFSSAIMNCGPNQIRVWDQNLGYNCIQNFQAPPADCVLCQGYQNYRPFPNWFANFPPAVYQPNPMPWWAYQGNMYYPNLHYPGAWSNSGINPGMNGQHYDGQGNVYAGKPNIYVESIHEEKKFSLSFPAGELSFLATTPSLDEKNTWKGKIVNKDRFEVEDIHYDYLFYDIRLPKEKMQFERGLCATRDEAIKWMLGDLKEMKFPAIALQDFEEHWKVKLPVYPFYCIYPQYNQQLDQVLPLSTNLEQTHFTRSLYVMIPHRKEPDVDEPQVIPFPVLDSVEIRPKTVIKHETMFKEWGVAFLGE
jgi:hypothetical protein